VTEICLANMTVIEAGPLELIDAAEAGEFDSVVMWLMTPPGVDRFLAAPRNVQPVIGQPVMIREIKRRLAATGIKVFGAFNVWLTLDFDAATLMPAFETSAELGGRNVAAVSWDEDWPRLVDHFAGLCDAAAQFGHSVAFEFMPYSAVKTIEKTAALVAEAARDNSGIAFDVLQYWRSNGRIDALRPSDCKTISYIQLCDAPAAPPPNDRLRDEAINGRLYPGEGELPLFAILDALPQSGLIEVEAPSAGRAHLPVMERARICGKVTREFLENYRQWRANQV
jgi:sugar phosphate isomerase/epimerase